MLRRNFLGSLMAGGALARLARTEQQAPQAAAGGVFLERPAKGQPHRGKVLLACQAHSDDVPLFASGTVAKLIEEGYTGYLLRASNDDMGDAPGLGTAGTIGEEVLGNERDTDKLSRIMGCKSHFDFNYNNHRMADISLNELICRLIFLVRLLKVDTVVCWDPWAHDEENPDHYMLARGVEAACWMAGRAHDYPEQFAAGLQPKAVVDKYYFARRPEITRVVDISKQIDKKVEVNRANTAKGTGGAPRIAAAGGTGEAQSEAAAIGRRRRHRRPGLHQGIRHDGQPRIRQALWRGVRRGLPLYRAGAPARTASGGSIPTSKSTPCRRSRKRVARFFAPQPRHPWQRAMRYSDMPHVLGFVCPQSDRAEIVRRILTRA